MGKDTGVPFRIITLCCFIAFIVPMSIQDGMFMDGLIYATVSKNLSQGIGTFWSPEFSATYLHDYREQLPLFFGLESIFFKVFGTAIYAERIFSFVMACLCAWLMMKTWRLIFESNEALKNLEWVPVLFWITIPTVFWAYINNVEENLMAVLMMASIFFVLKAISDQRRQLVFVIIAGVFIFLCSFCKGVQGLFPVTAIMIHRLCFRNFSFGRAVWLSFLLTLVPILIYSALMLNEESANSIVAFVNNRYVRTFTRATSATTTNRLYLIGKLVTDLAAPLGILLISFVVNKIRKQTAVGINGGYALFFALVGLTGSLPLIVTLEQRSFYLCTTFPLFAVSIAVLCASNFSSWFKALDANTRAFKIFRVVTIFLLVATIIASLAQIGKTKRDRELLHDVYAIGHALPSNIIIGMDGNLREEWSLIGYFSRYFNISLEPGSTEREYYLAEKSVEAPEGFEETGLGLVEYRLYRRAGAK